MFRAIFLSSLVFIPLFNLTTTSTEDLKPKSEAGWRCPVMKGAKILQGNGGSFSHRDEFNRYAWDYEIPIMTSVVASRSGFVSHYKMYSNIGGPSKKYIDDANEIKIKHSDGTESLYLHLSKNMALVREGEFVLQGELIGYSGNTGFSTRPHLHYTVFKDGKSTLTRFEDFKKWNGVPRYKDFHGPAKKPAVPQNIISEYKKNYRAAFAAKKYAWPDIGLAILNTSLTPKNKKYSDYYYHMMLLKLKAEFSKQLQDFINRMLKRVSESDELTERDVLEVARMRESLKSLKEFKTQHGQIEKIYKSIPKKQVRKATRSSSSIKPFVKAMNLHCYEYYLKAGGSYLSTMKKDRGFIFKVSKDRFKSLIRQYEHNFRKELNRLSDESKRSRKEHHALVKKDSEKLAKNVISLAKEWKKYLPEDRRQAEQLLSTVEAQYERILKRLK